jgi:hypothetical protein
MISGSLCGVVLQCRRFGRNAVGFSENKRFYILNLTLYFVHIIIRPLRRPRRRWADNIKMDLREIGWGGMDWIDLAQNRDQWRALLNTVMNLRVS